MKHFFAVLSCFFVMQIQAQSPCVRIVTVVPSEDKVTLQNMDSQTHDMSLWWMCSLFSCDSIASLPVISGSINLAAGDSVELEYPGLSDTAADVGIYSGDDILDPDIMVDFMQFGASASFGNEATAVAKGIWSQDDFIDDIEPYIFYGENCQENGLFWWQSPNSVIENDISHHVSMSLYDTNLEVKLDGLNKAMIQFVSLSGAIIREENIQSGAYHSYHLQEFSNGLVLVRIISERGTYVRKFFVN